MAFSRPFDQIHGVRSFQDPNCSVKYIVFIPFLFMHWKSTCLLPANTKPVQTFPPMRVLEDLLKNWWCEHSSVSVFEPTGLQNAPHGNDSDSDEQFPIAYYENNLPSTFHQSQVAVPPSQEPTFVEVRLLIWLMSFQKWAFCLWMADKRGIIALSWDISSN